MESQSCGMELDGVRTFLFGFLHFGRSFGSCVVLRCIYTVELGPVFYSYYYNLCQSL